MKAVILAGGARSSEASRRKPRQKTETDGKTHRGKT